MEVQCPNCGEYIGQTVPVCPYCGYAEDSNIGLQYRLFYDLIMNEQKRLKERDILNDYRLCKALAACYELQDYLDNRIAEYDPENC